MKDIRQLGIGRARYARGPAVDRDSFEAEIYDELRVIRFVWDQSLLIIQVPNDPGNPAIAALQRSLNEAKLRRFWLYDSGVTRFWHGRATRYQPVFADVTTGWFWIAVAGVVLAVPE